MTFHVYCQCTTPWEMFTTFCALVLDYYYGHIGCEGNLLQSEKDQNAKDQYCEYQGSSGITK